MEAKIDSSSHTPTQQAKYLTFSLEEEQFAVAICFVREIVRIQHITRAPDYPPYLRGVMNLRGKVVPVMDVRLRFGLPEREYDDRTCVIIIQVDEHLIGLIVDRVVEVINIADGDIEPPPQVRRGDKNRFLQGMGKQGDRVKLIIDAEKILYAEWEWIGGDGIS